MSAIEAAAAAEMQATVLHHPTVLLHGKHAANYVDKVCKIKQNLHTFLLGRLNGYVFSVERSCPREHSIEKKKTHLLLFE